MEIICKQPIKTIIDKRDAKEYKCFKNSSEKKKALKSYYNAINKIMRPNERKLICWHAYYHYMTNEEKAISCFEFAAFVMTSQRVYIAYELRGKIKVDVAMMDGNSYYDRGVREARYFNERAGTMKILDGFVLSYDIMIYFWHERDFGFALKMERLMDYLDIPSYDNEIYDMMFGRCRLL